MLIMITKNMEDVPEYKRPFKGKVFEVVDTRYGKYKPDENFRHFIEVKGQLVSVAPDEYKVVRV